MSCAGESRADPLRPQRAADDALAAADRRRAHRRVRRPGGHRRQGGRRFGVVLGDSARRELTAKPTENLAAYDEYLKGEAAAQEMKADRAGLRRAIGFFQRAVSLDSAFAQAWSQLARARTRSTPTACPTRRAGRRGADGARAGARAPARRSAGLPRRRRLLQQRQPDRERPGAMEEYERGCARARRRGHERGGPAVEGGAGTPSPRGSSAPRLDSLAYRGAPGGHGGSFLRRLRRRRLGRGLGDGAGAHQPQMVLLKVMVAVARGDLPGARRGPSGRGPDRRHNALHLSATYQDLYCAGRRAAEVGAGAAPERVRR